MASSPPTHDLAPNTGSLAPTIIAVSVALVVLSTLFTGLRVFTRVHILCNFKADDWAICVAQILAIIVSSLTILEVDFGLGKHVGAVEPTDIIKQLKVLYANILTYNLAMNIVKVSFLLLYLRIFQGPVIRKVIIVLIGYVIVWAIVQCVTLGLACMPLSIFMTSWVDSCLDTYPVWLVSSIMSTVTDFAIFVLPLPSLLKLHLNPKKKIVTVFMFCLGFFTCAISVIRIFTLKEALATEDPTYYNTGAACWSVVELNCAILCSCLPTLRPLVAKVVPGWTYVDPRTTYQMYANPRSTAKGGQGVTTSLDEAGDLETGQTDSTEHLKSSVACYAATNGVPAPAAEESAVAVPREVRRTGMGKILVTRETQVMRDVNRSSRPE